MKLVILCVIKCHDFNGNIVIPMIREVFKVSNPETKIQNDIRIALSANDCTVFRTNVGKVLMSNGRWFDTGLPKGHPDLYGFRHSDGKTFYIEVKTKTGKLRPDQIKFAEFISKYPVIYGIARSADEAVKLVSEE